MPKISAGEFEALVRDGIPYVGQLGITAETIEAGAVRLRLPYNEAIVRPGGTISGPALMALADVAMYALVLSRIGRVELAVTIQLNMNFLRRPALGPVIAEGRLLRIGKRIAVGEISLFSEGDHEPVAHATSTYSIPPCDR